MTINKGVNFSPNGMSIGSNTANVSIDASSETDAIALPKGTSLQRPNGQPGFIRYNSQTNTFEGFTNIWGPFGGGGAYQVDVSANGVIILANANVNFNNTATINVSLIANGNTEVNVAFSANGTQLGIPAANANALAAYAQANAAYTQANNAYAEANTANTLAQTASTTANSAYGQANLAYTTANSAANTVAVFANGTLTLADANVNFNNTATINVSSTANGTTQANVAFSVNLAAIAAADNNYEADILANGSLIIANANLNFNNTSTVNVGITANGITQANISFTVNTSAVSGSTSNVANAAYTKANAAYELANIAEAYGLIAVSNIYPVANEALAYGLLAITDIYAKANEAQHTVDTYANGIIVLQTANINFNNTSTVNVSATPNGIHQVNISFSANASGVASSYQADVLANGTLTLANANLNFNNTATVNVSVLANGSTQANISFLVNSAAIVGTAINSYSTVAIANQTVFTTTANTTQSEFVFVIKNGLVQIPTTDYSLTANNVVTFTSNCRVGDVVEVRTFPTIPVLTGANFVISSYSTFATANQTVFTMTANTTSTSYVIVTKNGLLQVPVTHYSITGNNVLTFTSNCRLNDLVEARIFPSTPISTTVNYGVDVWANDTIVLSNASLDFNNTSTVGVSITANGTTRANIALNVLSPGPQWQNVVNAAANTTIVAGQAIYANTLNITIFLPASPGKGNTCMIATSSGINNVVINRNGSPIMALTEDLTINRANVGVTFMFTTTATGWIII